MKILILGAGQVGGSVADNLTSEASDITVVDINPRILQDLQDRLDIRTVAGNATYPAVLRRAGADDADMLIAVTNSDEANMIACQVAATLFSTPLKIARVRAPDYLNQPQLFGEGGLPIDVLISPEQLVMESVMRLIEHPGALQVLDFADGKVRLVAVRAYYGGPLVGNELRALREHMPGIHARVAAIFRRGSSILPTGKTVIEVGDEVFFIAARKNIRAVMSELRRLEKPVKRIIIAGGGNIGKRLAQALETRYQIKVIERNAERAHVISEELNRAIVLLGDAADEDLLLEENIENTDVFCSLTNDDEANILSAMLAKRRGARLVISLINRPAYVDLVQGSEDIDVAVSPQQATIGSVLAYIRRGDIVNVHSLRRGAAEAIEAIAHGDRSNSRVVGRRISQIKLPEGATIGAVVRGDEVLMGRGETVIQADDHVILFLVDKRRINEVERLFQVGVGFF